MPRPTALLLMFGYSEANDVRRLVQDARLAASEDLLSRLRDLGWERVVFCSNRPDILSAPGIEVQRLADDGHRFHFGRELQSLVHRCGLEEHAVLYVGGGLPLLSQQTVGEMLAFLAGCPRGAITNNLHSCDFIGWTPGSAALEIAPPETDNDLAWQLRRTGMEVAELPRSAETIFDIDTPTDLLLLTLAQDLGSRLSQVVARLPESRLQPQAMMSVLRSFEHSTLLYGRIAHHAWAYFQQKVACQTRLISEERGMRASGRLARGEVRSLLGFIAEQAGIPATFSLLTQLANALILDTRVLMAHRRQWPSVEDRFHSDLGLAEAIEDDWLRRTTRAALDCGAPVLLGGHCLVSGGLYLLGDAVGPKEFPF